MSLSEYHDPIGFGLTVHAREDGTLEAAYVRVSRKQVARTEELIESVLLLDLDQEGDMVGIEIVAPVKVSEIMELANRLEASQRKSFENFVRHAAPPGLIFDGLDSRSAPVASGRYDRRFAEAGERAIIDRIAPSDEELEALADRLPAPPEWYEKG